MAGEEASGWHRATLARGRATDMDGYCQGLDPTLRYFAAQEISQSPGPYFFLWPLLGAIHFITLLLLFSSLAHKQCGQFPFTCPGISDSSPAGVALSGYTVECLANKIHKAEIGKSMPLLIMLCHLSYKLREGLPTMLAPETLKGRLPWARGASWPCLPEPFTQGASSQLWSPGQVLTDRIPSLCYSRSEAWLLNSTGLKELSMKIGDIMTLRVTPRGQT